MTPPEHRTPRRQINVPEPVYEALQALRGELGRRTGARPTTVEVVNRATACLVDAHTRGAWLSPEEAQPVHMERAKTMVVEIVGAVVHHATDLRLSGVAFDDQNNVAIVVLDGHAPIAVPIGEPRAEIAAAPMN